MKYLKATPYGKAKAKILLLSPLLAAYWTVQQRWVRPSLLAPHWPLLGYLLPPATLDLLERMEGNEKKKQLKQFIEPVLSLYVVLF